ncbi:MAG: hypothetical protein H0U03_04345 [Actinobacteria bacterium]|nr:hypothetical protein [Actinomycetota bacterium]
MEEQGAERLPDREVVSFVDASAAIPINAAITANFLSDDGSAYHDATHGAGIYRSNEEELMTDEMSNEMGNETKAPGLSPEELESQGIVQLADSEAKSLVDANSAAPVNTAVARSILSDDSETIANAEQDADIDQRTSRTGDQGA